MSFFGIKGIRVRIFNTTGPRKMGDVCADLTFRAIQIERGYIPPALRVGSMENRRAILDVRDLVSALILLAAKVHLVKYITQALKKCTQSMK